MTHGMTITIETISPAELHEKTSDGDIEIIDVRTPAEFREVHATAASNRPSIHSILTQL